MDDNANDWLSKAENLKRMLEVNSSGMLVDDKAIDRVVAPLHVLIDRANQVRHLTQGRRITHAPPGTFMAVIDLQAYNFDEHGEPLPTPARWDVGHVLIIRPAVGNTSVEFRLQHRDRSMLRKLGSVQLDPLYALGMQESAWLHLVRVLSLGDETAWHTFAADIQGSGAGFSNTRIDVVI